jgi:uncharacterized protein YndB with AHSA1/START domain
MEVRAQAMQTIPTLALAACLLAWSDSALRAETSDVTTSGFTSTHAMVVDAQPQQVWQAFTQLPKWWNSTHTWSGQASNLSLDATAGGCWCERWADGASAAHGRVLLVLPGSALRLHAWLGPLQEMPVAGVLTFGTARRDGATRLRVTYRVAGAPDSGLDKLAPAVDSVLAEQVKRLKAFIETGKPDARASRWRGRAEESLEQPRLVRRLKQMTDERVDLSWQVLRRRRGSLGGPHQAAGGDVGERAVGAVAGARRAGFTEGHAHADAHPAGAAPADADATHADADRRPRRHHGHVGRQRGAKHRHRTGGARRRHVGAGRGWSGHAGVGRVGREQRRGSELGEARRHLVGAQPAQRQVVRLADHEHLRAAERLTGELRVGPFGFDVARGAPRCDERDAERDTERDTGRAGGAHAHIVDRNRPVHAVSKRARTRVPCHDLPFSLARTANTSGKASTGGARPCCAS